MLVLPAIGFAILVLVAAAAAGAQLRSLREGTTDLARSQAAAKPTPTATPTVWPTVAADPAKTPSSTPQPTAKSTPPSAASTPPVSQKLFAVSGRVTKGGKPVAGVDVRIYPANDFNRGPTPVPPSAAETRTSGDGTYRALLAPGSYRVGSWLTGERAAIVSTGYWFSTWYGRGAVIGAGADVVVRDRDVSAIDIVWLRAVRITGRVLDADGKGVAQAQVAADTNAPGVARVAMSTATADAGGGYIIHMAEGGIHLAAVGGDPSAPSWTERDIVAHADATVDLVLPAPTPTQRP